MKKIIYMAGVLLICLSSCTKNFDKLNTNPNTFLSPDFDPVMSYVFKQTTDQMENDNWGYFWEYGHIIDPYAERYLTGDNSRWNTYYINVLGNLRQLKKLYGTNPGFTNRMAIAQIWECYIYYQLVATYGPVPYSQAGATTPVILYDDENTIYTALLTKLKAASTAIVLTGDDMTTDLIFGGNLTKWQKFANTLRLKIALNVQKNLPSLAASNIQDVMSNEALLPQSDADDAIFTYGTASGSQSAYFNHYVLNESAANAVKQSSGPIMSDYVFTYFRSYNDPRLGAYFNPAQVPIAIKDTLTSTADAFHYIVTYTIPHLGTPKSLSVLAQWNLGTQIFQGSLNYITNFSTLPGLTQLPVTTNSGINVLAANRPFYHSTYADVCFMKAEANMLGFGGAQSAQAYYTAGINANFAFWGLTAAQATAYEAQNGIAWSTAGHGFNYPLGFINTSIPADNMTKIWIQQWMNSYGDGAFDAWCLQRRTQNLILPPHTNPGAPNLLQSTYADLPDRWNYPVAETSVNPVGAADGTKKLGGSDYPTTVLQFSKTYTHTNWATVVAFYDDSYIQKWYGTTIQQVQAVPNIKYTVLSQY
ncbi:Starch-binding associating with outer membrane [Mucilaginibacter mallensis]|uniref:Starch-binding associating with outer membrane n=1 Tax=Mucilaginibacter mallensis TaxID=652787 RepID=A0A1H1SIT9_MUCMA|nr:SusD/RagB family nutrient-binding outer membrane lipoprotein [Mucilaginibacter mallensis]SDS47738.1 Starch-binding associating with outer membrane [Mucilaginibacter mallensis]